MGDCGSAVIDPGSGAIYGFVVAHDTETEIAYVIPAISVFESIASHCHLPEGAVESIFNCSSFSASQAAPIGQ